MRVQATLPLHFTTEVEYSGVSVPDFLCEIKCYLKHNCLSECIHEVQATLPLHFTTEVEYSGFLYLTSSDIPYRTDILYIYLKHNCLSECIH